MLPRHSVRVGIGREFGRANGARGGGSWKIWCEILLCLYLCPRRWLMFCFNTGPFARGIGLKLNGFGASPSPVPPPPSLGADPNVILVGLGGVAPSWAVMGDSAFGSCCVGDWSVASSGFGVCSGSGREIEGTELLILCRCRHSDSYSGRRLEVGQTARLGFKAPLIDC